MAKGNTEYFALYDYDHGGLWMILAVRSAEEIRCKYPMLQVFEGEPPMLDAAAIAAIRDSGVRSIDDPPSDWLADLVAN